MTKKPLTDESGEVRDISDELGNFRPAAEVLAGVLPQAVYDEMFQKKSRGPQKEPTKELISIRLSPEVLEAYRATGKGWQARMDEDLKTIVLKIKAA